MDNGHLIVLLPKILILLGFQIFWRRLFQKQVVRMQFDIYYIFAQRHGQHLGTYNTVRRQTNQTKNMETTQHEKIKQWVARTTPKQRQWTQAITKGHYIFLRGKLTIVSLNDDTVEWWCTCVCYRLPMQSLVITTETIRTIFRGKLVLFFN